MRQSRLSGQIRQPPAPARDTQPLFLGTTSDPPKPSKGLGCKPCDTSSRAWEFVCTVTSARAQYKKSFKPIAYDQEHSCLQVRLFHACIIDSSAERKVIIIYQYLCASFHSVVYYQLINFYPPFQSRQSCLIPGNCAYSHLAEHRI